MGVLRGTLFLEDRPLSLDELAEKTGYSKTTVRANMSYLENLGLAVRVVDPGSRKHRYRQHRYAMETDAEAMKLVFFSSAKEEIHSILQALDQIEKNLDGQSSEGEEIRSTVTKTRKFYQEMEKILELLTGYTVKDLIEALDTNKNEGC